MKNNYSYSVKSINLKHYKNIYKSLSCDSSPFQKYQVVNSVCNPFFAVRYKAIVKHFAVFYQEVPSLIASFRYYYNNDDDCSVLGSQECFDIVDFVYSDVEFDILVDLFKALFDHVKHSGKTNVEFNWMPSDTRTKSVLIKLCEDKVLRCDFEPINNVKIPIFKFNSYDMYIRSLSKSVRQNIRTAYNRINRDNCLLDLNVYYGNKDLSYKTIKKGLSLYLKGQKSRYDNYGLSHWVHFKYLHYVSKTMQEDFSFHASLNINGNMAAIMQGYIDVTRHDIQIPRLAIDPDFSYYSPGYLMICETVKMLFSNDNIDSLDLMRGCEKYKLDLGGEIYHTYNCKIVIL